MSVPREFPKESCRSIKVLDEDIRDVLAHKRAQEPALLAVAKEIQVSARRVSSSALYAAIELSRLRDDIDAVAEEERIVGRLDSHTPAHEETRISDQHCKV